QASSLGQEQARTLALRITPRPRNVTFGNVGPGRGGLGTGGHEPFCLIRAIKRPAGGRGCQGVARSTAPTAHPRSTTPHAPAVSPSPPPDDSRTSACLSPAR